MKAQVILALLVLSLSAATSARAAFTTVINSPPESVQHLYDIGSNTQVNLYPGAVTGPLMLAGSWLPLDNIEVNVKGGMVSDGLDTGGWRVANTNIVVNLFEGLIDGNLDAKSGSVINLYGGTVGNRYYTRLSARSGSLVNISGGLIKSWIGGAEGSVVNISGGSAGRHLSFSAGSQLNISGGEFRLNGVPIGDLATVGTDMPLNLPADSLLTGTLSDGTPLAVSNQHFLEDFIDDGTLTLRATAVPAAPPTIFHAPSGNVPRGLRGGQRLVVSDGGDVPDNFNANWGSVVTMTGGQIGRNFETTGAIVNISGGFVGEQMTAFMGSVVNLSGGTIDSNFLALAGSTVNVTGGTVGILFEAGAGSVVNYSGGAIESVLHAHEGSQFNILGGEFRVNGVPLTGLSAVGAARPFDIPPGAVLSGTLADGSSFVLSGVNLFGDYFADGSLTLRAAPLPERGPAVIHVPTDPAPPGLRTGQTLVVSTGGALPDNFTAGWGTAVNIEGGDVGDFFQATGALVNISGGTIGNLVDAYYGSVVNISGGTFLGLLTANKGSVVNISGGTIDRFTAGQGGVVNITGGTIAQYSYANDGSVVNISGGSVGEDFWIYAATVNVSGGSIGDGMRANNGSAVNISGGVMGDDFDFSGRVTLSGTDFRLDGASIAGLQQYGLPLTVEVPAGSVLSGTLADGTPFVFSPQDGDNMYGPGSLQVQEWPTEPRGPAIVGLPGNYPPRGVRAGQTLYVGPGGAVGDNFNAGWGSVVTIDGGQVGRNFEAVGARVLIAGGEIGEGFDAFFGSDVNITGGIFGQETDRGPLGNFTAQSGSVVTISGGTFGPGFHAAAGSEVHLVGSAFFLNGLPIAGLAPGQSLEITVRDLPLGYYNILSGSLLDGSEFSFHLNSDSDYDSSFADYFDASALLTATLVLTADFNGDNVVNASDLVGWKAAFASSAAGDSDGDLDSDGVDFLAWQRQFDGRIAAATDVPEPPALRLTIALALSVALGARSWSREIANA